MSSMDIDKPLDEIISSKPRRGRGGRGPRGAGRASGDAANGAGSGSARARYSGSAPRSAGARAPAPAAPAGKPITADAIKIIISNLPNDVNEAAVRDLMQSTVGPVRSVQMSYTSTGKSTGVATVLFKNKGDANKAHAAYHNRMIDNQRPMRVEIAIDPNALQTLASRVAPAAKPAAGNGGRKPAAGRAGGRSSKPRAPRPAKKTAEDLDAEMSAYKSSATA